MRKICLINNDFKQNTQYDNYETARTKLQINYGKSKS